MSQAIVQAFRDFGAILQGQLPDSTGQPITPENTEADVRGAIEAYLERVFRDRDKAINFCESLVAAEDDPDDLEEIVVAVAIETFLEFTLAGIAAKLAMLAVQNVAREAMRAALDESIKVGVNALAASLAQTARQSTADLIRAVFEGQRLALSHLWTETIAAFNLRFSATYASAGTATAANAYFEELRRFLARLWVETYNDQLFASAAGYASALAQHELGQFDPASFENQEREGQQRRGTDIFTKRVDKLLGGTVPGVLRFSVPDRFVVSRNPATGEAKVEYTLLANPDTGEQYLNPAFKGTLEPLFLENVGLPEKVLSLLCKRPVGEWGICMVVRLPLLTFKVNEDDQIWAQVPRDWSAPPPAIPNPDHGSMYLDRDTSRRLWEEIGRPAVMRLMVA